MIETAIESRNLGRRSGERWVLRHMDLQVPAGAVCGLLGRPGAGKTTALRALAGLVCPHEGEVLIRGIDPQRDRLSVMRSVGCAGGELTPLAAWTVRRALDFYSWIHDDWDRGRSEVLRRRFALAADRRLRDLSAGQRSRLSLLPALVRRPAVLLLDEPFATLEGIVRHEVMRGLIDLLPDSGTTVLLTASRIEDLEWIVDHVAVLQAGRIRFAGPFEDFRASVRRVRLGSRRRGHEPGGFPWLKHVERQGTGWSATLVDYSRSQIEQLKAAGFSIEALETPALPELAAAMMEDDAA